MKVKVTDNLEVAAASTKLAAAGAFGVVVGLIFAAVYSWKIAPLAAWDAAAVAYVVATWRRVLAFDALTVKKHALREDPSRVTADIVLIVASLASLVAVILVLVGGTGLTSVGQSVMALVSVVVSWATIHTLFALRYAELYYGHPEGGVDFGETKEPVYADFAYLAFTLGMTFQVSDTPFKRSEFRATGLRHALLSYLFGTIIIATTINLIAGLTK
jgi:uncharacterized membrane protein